MATYLPDPTATWLAAVRGAVVLMAPASAASELAALWPALTHDDPTPLALDRLTAGGLSATPSFALVVHDSVHGSARVVVRGELAVRAGDSEVSGSGVSTWTEQVVQSRTFEIAVTGPVPDASPLPVLEAIVSARSVQSEGVEPVVTGDRMTAVPVAAPATAPTPTPAAQTPAVVAPAVPAPAAAATPAPAVAAPAAIQFPPAPPAAAEQTMVPAEDTIAGPSTPARAMPVTSPPDPAELDGDHDGLTVASIDIRRLRAERAAARVGNGTPPSGSPAIADARTAAQPAASLRMPDGALEPIGHDVVLGRAPSVSQVSGGRLPRLITIGAGDPDISRSHVRIAVEGDTVVITDLHSRNGTHVVAPGRPPVKLRAGEPTPVLAGTVVDLGGGWTVQVVGE
jgi:hypothetical protein